MQTTFIPTDRIGKLVGRLLTYIKQHITFTDLNIPLTLTGSYRNGQNQQTHHSFHSIYIPPEDTSPNNIGDIRN